MTKNRLFFYRLMLLLMSALVVYLCIRVPAYNFSPWIPDQFLELIGVTKKTLILFHHNEDKFAHFIFGMLAAVLSFLSWPSNNRLNKNKIFCILSIIFCSLCFAAELVQVQIGRNFSYPDAFIGLAGSISGLVLVLFFKQRDNPSGA